MAHLHLNNYDNPDIRQQSSGFDIPTGGLQQQPMVPTLLNMISQLTSLLNESYARQNINIQIQSKEHELNKKIEQLVSEVEYYKKECNRLKEEKEVLREKWGKSNWCIWIEKNRLKKEKENFQKKWEESVKVSSRREEENMKLRKKWKESNRCKWNELNRLKDENEHKKKNLEESISKCKVLEKDVQKYKEEKVKIQRKWKESNRYRWKEIHRQKDDMEIMQHDMEIMTQMLNTSNHHNYLLEKDVNYYSAECEKIKQEHEIVIQDLEKNIRHYKDLGDIYCSRIIKMAETNRTDITTTHSNRPFKTCNDVTRDMAVHYCTLHCRKLDHITESVEFTVDKHSRN
ncbi:predicted protein [Chaetoceros tenuissimus]|uniref:Uncharacterized protein n=1 Tax=Chaetoceros tenuissimus TaxID=426638 RepID=A0AAD3GZJ2_9STRA|nr:predicted protein [Chaetoceros tenuissimus]